MQSDKIQLVAQTLQRGGYLDVKNGAPLSVIQAHSGIARSTLYRIMDSNEAKRWGIFRTNKVTQPYEYFVDNQTLITYQTVYDASKEDVPVYFDDPMRQMAYETLNRFVIKAVIEMKKPDFFVENFGRLLVNTEPATVFKQWDTMSPTGKMLHGLLLAFQNIEDTE